MMEFYDEASSNDEEDSSPHRGEPGTSQLFGKSEDRSNGLVCSSGSRENAGRAGQKFVPRSDDEGSYDNTYEKDESDFMDDNTNRRTMVNSNAEHSNFQNAGDDSDSGFEGSEHNYLAQSKHRSLYKSKGKISASDNDAGDEDYKNESNGDGDFVVSDEEEEDEDYENGDSYSGRFRKHFVPERSAKAKGKRGVRINLKRESVGRRKLIQPQLDEDNYDEEEDFEEVDGKKKWGGFVSSQ